MLNRILYVISSILFFTVLFSCEDDLRFDEAILDGEGNISFEVDYNPLKIVDVNTGTSRAPGNAIGDIGTLTVYMYDKEETLLRIIKANELPDYTVDQKGNDQMPADGGQQSESKTAKAKFTVSDIPYGHYYFYVVANIAPYPENEVETVSKLKSKEVEWKSDITTNNQMFGYFTHIDNQTSNGFDAHLCTISKTTTHLHAWMKRLASKVTVVFDGSGLHENIWVYIKSVMIKDIPATCTIGKENRVPIDSIPANIPSPPDKPSNWDEVFAQGETLLYNSQGITTEDPGQDYNNWLAVAKGSGLLGAVSVEGTDTIYHSENAPALYFYENCQGNYEKNPNKEWYSKLVKYEDTGNNVDKWGERDFKDNVPGGTYIEVQGYYVSTNENQVSNGPIIYRFMLGQDVTYDYNAVRNDHYKVTLGFKGYANQPDWHINYSEKPTEIYTGQKYYLSYGYNQKGIFPIRIVGDVETFDVEIVENNWAPFDGNNATTSWDSVPPATVGSGDMAFKWNRAVYENKGKKDELESKNSSTSFETTGYYYGLHKTGFTQSEIEKGAPNYRTPIWAGFLALQVPEELGAVIFANDHGFSYSNTDQVGYLKKYFEGTGGGSATKDGKQYTYTNTINQYKRSFTKDDLTFAAGNTEKIINEGTNNACKITKAKDGSITIHLPMWTRQKNLFSISGFTGNNPYDTYQRKATVMLTARYGKSGNTVTQFKPVYQVRRVVNPKGVWRTWNKKDAFDVTLMRRLTPDADQFTAFDSDGEWRAYVSAPSGGANFFTLSGGYKSDGKYIYGHTDTPISFKIKFNGLPNADATDCAVIHIEYHGYTCSHSIFVRQGYFNPIEVVGPAKWSSFSLYKCASGTNYATQWDPTTQNYIEAEVTASPLALGTLFKRGNYAQGILVSNNARTELGPLQDPGSTTFYLTNGNPAAWRNIDGLSFTNSSDNKTKYPNGTLNHDFKWGRFHAKINGEDRYYRVPTHDEYMRLLEGEYGVGVLYADGATQPAVEVSDAFGFEDVKNNANQDYTAMNARGMRGIIVYNPTTANQIFFPLGARGIGRRTLQNASGNSAGVLRYGAVPYVLSYEDRAANQFRPIPYNLPASPGALYWLNEQYGDSYLSWDMNYFDLNFNAYDFASSFYPTGDALPIKLVLDKIVTNNKD